MKPKKFENIQTSNPKTRQLKAGDGFKYDIIAITKPDGKQDKLSRNSVSNIIQLDSIVAMCLKDILFNCTKQM